MRAAACAQGHTRKQLFISLNEIKSLPASGSGTLLVPTPEARQQPRRCPPPPPLAAVGRPLVSLLASARSKPASIGCWGWVNGDEEMAAGQAVLPAGSPTWPRRRGHRPPPS